MLFFRLVSNYGSPWQEKLKFVVLTVLFLLGGIKVAHESSRRYGNH